MSFKVDIIADSLPAHNGHRLTTFVVTFPRFILAEFNTHRMLSRNAASSRAIPIDKQIKAIYENPFIPETWGSAKRGMQAGPDLPEQSAKDASILWIEARDKAAFVAGALERIGVHKQLANRVLEPFAWVTVIVTATDWDNFFNLRTHEDAQPEFRKLALMMLEAYQSHEPMPVEVHDWHLPFITKDDCTSATMDDLVKISAGRCARVSYLTHDGKRDIVEDIRLATSLKTNGHMSPFEHQAICQHKPHRVGNFFGWTQARKLIVDESDPKAKRREQ